MKKNFATVVFAFVFITIRINIVCSWDLSPYEINDNFFVSDIAIYFNRAFLAIPRKVCANNVTEPTLLEVPWKEVGPHFLTTRNHKITQSQTWAQCNDLQSAAFLALESRRSKLWILDQGNEFCPPKFLFFSIFLNSFGEEALQIGGIDGKRLTSIVVEDSFPDKSRAFISNTGSNSLLLVYLDSLNYQILRISEEKRPQMPIEIDYLTLSKTAPILYFTGGESLELFELDLRKLENESVAINDTLATDVTLLGYKLGKSTGLETDYKNGLIYYLVNDFAVVRWIAGTPMTAETHNVLAQSYKRLPYVSKIFTGPQNGIWALVNPRNPRKDCLVNNKNEIIQEKHEKTKKIKHSNNNAKFLKSRVVKIMKFNKFFDEKFDHFNNDLGN